MRHQPPFRPRWVVTPAWNFHKGWPSVYVGVECWKGVGLFSFVSCLFCVSATFSELLSRFVDVAFRCNFFCFNSIVKSFVAFSIHRQQQRYLPSVRLYDQNIATVRLKCYNLLCFAYFVTAAALQFINKRNSQITMRNQILHFLLFLNWNVT